MPIRQVAAAVIGGSRLMMPLPLPLHWPFPLAFAVGTTKVIEDGFQRLRALEQRGQCNKKVVVDRMWAQLITQRLLSSVHAFEEIDFSSVGLKRFYEELPRRPAPGDFKPGSVRPVLPLHHLVSAKQEAGGKPT